MFENTTGFTDSSSRSHGMSFRQADLQNVLRGIFISVMDHATTRANPTPNRQRHLCSDLPTMRAALTRGIPAVNLSKRLAVPVTFVFQIELEYAKPSVTDALGEAVVLDHAAHVQILNANHVKAFDQISRDFVQVIASRVGNVGVDASNFKLLSFPASATLFASRENPLRFRQALLMLAGVLGIANSFAIGQRGEAIDSQVHADTQTGLWQRLERFIQNECRKVAPSAVLGYRDRAWIAFERSRPTDVEPAQTSNLQTARTRVPFKAGTGVLGGLITVLAAEVWVLGTFVKEVAESGLQVSKCLLRWNARDFVQPQGRFLLLQDSQCRTRAFVADGLPFGVIAVGSQAQTPVVHESASAECASKDFLLLKTGIKPELEPELHKKQYTPVSAYTQIKAVSSGAAVLANRMRCFATAPFIPRLKTVGFLEVYL
jgi:hypothetical protein